MGQKHKICDHSTACKHLSCYTCRFINTATKITGPEGSDFVVHQPSSITTGVVYHLSCKRCNQLYIGKTKRRMADWFVEHLYTTRMKDFSFLINDGHKINDICVCIINCYKINEVRKCRDKKLIYSLRTLEPHEMNVKFCLQLLHHQPFWLSIGFTSYSPITTLLA